MLTKIEQIIAVQHHCSLQLRTAILMLSAIWLKLVLTKIKRKSVCSLQLRTAIFGHLVEAGADKDQAQNLGATPLFTAAQNGYLYVSFQ